MGPKIPSLKVISATNRDVNALFNWRETSSFHKLDGVERPFRTGGADHMPLEAGSHKRRLFNMDHASTSISWA